MASLYDSASLVMIPSGVKEDKLYSIKPTDGSGDFTFSRGSDIQATRVNASGLIEKARENEVKYSQEYGGSGTANWANVGTATITTDNTTAPDGTSTADKIAKASGSTSGVYQILSVSSGSVYTQSVYLKNDSNCDDMLLGCDLNPTNANLRFNPQTGAISSVGAGVIDSSATDVGSGWYRVSITYQTTSVTNTFLIYNLSSVASSFFAWGAQLNHGLIAQDYVATTTTAVVEGLTADLPRLDYSGGASCPSLLLEPSRTNLVTLSEYIGGWSGTNTLVVNNDTTSPEGVINAAEIESTSASGGHYIGSPNFAMTSGSDYSGSIFVKAGTGRYFQLFFGGVSFTTNGYANFDLQEGEVTAEGSAVTGDIEPYGNDWYRVSISGTSAATGAATLYVGIITSGTAPRVQSHTSVLSYHIWGGQTELGNYPTSLIPTYGTAAVRGREECEKTGVSSLIGQTNGTFFVEMKAAAPNAGFNNYWSIADAAGQNRLLIGQNSAPNQFRFYLDIGTSGQGFNYSVDDITTPNKAILRYTNSGENVSIFLNGVKKIDVSVGQSLNGTLSRIISDNGNSSQYCEYNTNQLLVFPTALTDAECIALTT